MKIISLIVNLFQEFPSTNSLNTTGIVYSDHPVENNGWIKGWCLNTPTRDIVVVCKHSNPSTTAPNNTIFVRDNQGQKHIRAITRIDKEPFNIRSTNEYYMGGDIALCKLNEPLPDTIALYNIFTSPFVYGKKTVSLNQHKKWSFAKLTQRGSVHYVKGNGRDPLFSQGDSGLPWFVYQDGEWQVVSHTFRGLHGEGPWYDKLSKEIQERASKL